MAISIYKYPYEFLYTGGGGPFGSVIVHMNCTGGEVARDLKPIGVDIYEPTQEEGGTFGSPRVNPNPLNPPLLLIEKLTHKRLCV